MHKTLLECQLKRIVSRVIVDNGKNRFCRLGLECGHTKDVSLDDLASVVGNFKTRCPRCFKKKSENHYQT
jgi:hypothetical protein